MSSSKPKLPTKQSHENGLTGKPERLLHRGLTLRPVENSSTVLLMRTLKGTDKALRS